MIRRLHVLNSSRCFLLCCLLCAAIPPAVAQQRVSASLFKPSPLLRESNFLHLPDSLKADTGGVQSINTKSPTTAVLLSAVLPGAGQVYTGRYWKVPIILGFGGYFATEWFRMNDHYRNARTKYDESVKAGENKGQGDSQLLYERDFYHDERDRFAQTKLTADVA